MRKTLLLSLAAAFGALAPTGCAVLTVDVDVYKGPLADQWETQVQHLGNVIDASKEILVSLRDRIEWPGDFEVRNYRAAWWYEDGFIPDPDTNRFVNPKAQSVNNLLWLIEAPWVETKNDDGGAELIKRLGSNGTELEPSERADLRLHQRWRLQKKVQHPMLLGTDANGATETDKRSLRTLLGLSMRRESPSTKTAATGGPPSADEARREVIRRSNLFATRVLRGANFESLFGAEYDGQLKRFWKSTKQRVWGADGDEPDSGEYVQVLQALGNSIRIQANALQAKMDHDERADIELAAAERVIHRELDTRPGGPALPAKSKLGYPEDAAEVADVARAVLAYDYVEDLKDGGSRSNNIEAAMRGLADYRRDMIFLLPASTYLASSYPATTLQSDAQLGWSNMLAQSVLRQIPGGVLDGEPYPDQYRTLQDLDKQFWQNINTVRVAGTGDTHYVVAKDDVGNWYVKSYAADPKDVIAAAKGMALYSASGGAAGNLLALNEADEATGGATQPTSAGRKQFTGISGTFVTATKADIADLVKRATGLRDRIGTVDASKLDAAAVQTVLAEAETAHLDAVKKLTTESVTDPWALSKTAREGIDALRRFHNAASTGITTKDLVATKRTAVADATKKTADAKAVLDSLDAAVTKAKAAVDAVVDDPLVTTPAETALQTATKARDDQKTKVDELIAAEAEPKKALAEAQSALSALLTKLTSTVREEIDAVLARRKRAIENLEVGVGVVGSTSVGAPKAAK